MPEPDRDLAPLPVVAAVIRGDDGRILVARRNKEDRHGGLWEFPGGKVEGGETPKDALVREIREELGVEIEVGRALPRIVHDYPERSICLMAYKCRIVDGVPRALECWQVAWVAPADIPSYPMPEADLPIARLLSREALR